MEIAVMVILCLFAGIFFTIICAAIILEVVLFGILAWMAANTIFELFDSISRPTITGRARVVRKRFVPEHEEKCTEIIGDITMDSTRTIPDCWTVVVELLDHELDTEISESVYGSIKDSDKVTVRYCLGRFSGRPYLDDTDPIVSTVA